MTKIVERLRVPIRYWGQSSEDSYAEYCPLRLEAADLLDEAVTVLRRALDDDLGVNCATLAADIRAVLAKLNGETPR